MTTIKKPQEMTVSELNEHLFYHWDTTGKVQKEVNRRLTDGEEAVKKVTELEKEIKKWEDSRDGFLLSSQAKNFKIMELEKEAKRKVDLFAKKCFECSELENDKQIEKVTDNKEPKTYSTGSELATALYRNGEVDLESIPTNILKAAGFALSSTSMKMPENDSRAGQVYSAIERVDAEIKKRDSIDITPEAPIDQPAPLPKPPEEAKSGGSSLIEEARKYKTAEEFVKAQGEPLYHGTDAAIERPTLSHSGRTDEGFLGKGIYLTSTKKMAKVYGKNRIELYIDIKNPLVIEDAMAFGGVNPDKIRNILGLKVNAKPSEVRAALIKQGYDGVVVNEITDNGIRKNAEVVALNDSQIKTKADLTSIWNKAQETLPATLPKPPEDSISGKVEAAVAFLKEGKK